MYSYLRASERGRSIELLEGVLICGRAKDRWIQQNAKLLMVYYIHFKITGDSCNLISSHWCDLFTNRTIFCSKSHLFPSQWGKFTKMQPVACLKKPNKVKVRRTNLVALWLSVVNQTQSNHEDQSQQRRALQCSLYVVSSNSKSKQANCLKRSVSRDQPMVGFSFASDWLRGWRKFSGPITDRSKVQPVQSWITFDTCLKIAL